MIDLGELRSGVLAFVPAFLTAGLFTLAFKGLYQLVTPYKEGRLIREGNTAAALALGGAVMGYVIPLASALSHTVSLPEFAAWAAIAGVIQIVTFWGVRRVALPDVSERIERGEMAAAVYLTGISLIVGVLNAACMTT